MYLFAKKISSSQVRYKQSYSRNVKTFSPKIFILFSIGSQLGCYRLKTEQNKVKVIGCGKRYSPIHQIRRPNLTRKPRDDVNATTPYPYSQTTTSSIELTITLCIGRYSYKFGRKKCIDLHKILYT